MCGGQEKVNMALHLLRTLPSRDLFMSKKKQGLSSSYVALEMFTGGSKTFLEIFEPNRLEWLLVVGWLIFAMMQTMM